VARLPLSSVSSLRRDIGNRCTVLRIHDGRVFAGSHEGVFACWSEDSGESFWRVEMSGPLSDISFGTDRVYVAESSKLHCLDIDSGENIWSKELEGSSDYVMVNDSGIWATSSVYEIEIGDYTESTIWKFSYSGEIERFWTIAERCWFLGPYNEGLILGLGRPRCGALSVLDDQLEHLDVGGGPVTCGTDFGNRIILGHSGGMVTNIGNSTEMMRDSPTSAVLGVDDETIAGFEDGGVVSSVGWSHNSRGGVASISLGPYRMGEGAVWICLDEGVTVLNRTTGANLLELSHESKIWKSDTNERLIVLGDDDGIIHFVERDVMSRRLDAGSDNFEDIDKKKEMMDKLRRLRGI